MQAVIVAGGLSTRINKEREIIPKSLYTVEGKCLIEHVILNLKNAGISDFIVIVGFMADRIALRLGDGSELGVNIKYVMTPYFHKTLGLSLLLAQEHIKGQFILAMSDHLIEQEAVNKIVNFHLEEDSCALLIDKKIKDIFWLDDAAKVKLENNLIKGVSKDYTEFSAIDCGIFKCNPLIFNEIRKVKDRPDSMSHAVSFFSDKGKMFAVDIGEYKWIDVDEYDELEVARVMFRNVFNSNLNNNSITKKD